jgi:hypothetical protein
LAQLVQQASRHVAEIENSSLFGASHRRRRPEHELFRSDHEDFQGGPFLRDNGVMRGRDPGEKHKQFLRELNEERAAALLRIGSTLESLILQLRAARERVRSASGPDREREVETWQGLRARAVRYRWYLEVQREALGMRRHDVLDEFYQVPSLD